MIVKTATFTLDFGAGAVDFSDHVIGVAFDKPSSVVDDRTFGLPHASDVVEGVHSLTARVKWSSAFMALIDGEAETEADMVFTTETSGSTVSGTVKFAGNPIPEFTEGEKVEADWVFAVVDELDWAAAV